MPFDREIKTWSWGFNLLALGLFAIGTVATLNSFVFNKNAIETNGTVVDVVIVHTGSSINYKPTMSFQVDGETIEAQSRLSSWKYNFEEGEQVTLFYDQRDPNDIRLDYFMERVGNDLFLFGVALFVLAVGFVVILSMKRAKLKVQEQEKAQEREYDQLLHYYEEETILAQPPAVDETSSTVIRKR